MPRRTAGHAKDHQPDLIDVDSSVVALWNDHGLYFRSTAVVRNGKLLVRGYAQSEHTLQESINWYQAYHEYPLSSYVDYGRCLWALVTDLYAQADRAKAFGQWKDGRESVVG